MRIAINLGPHDDWPAILDAAQRSDASGFDALSFLDHYYADKPDWSWLCGWALYGALAMVTSRIHLVPMVIDHLNYLPGVLAKEAATLSIISKGRFELGIGAGDFFEEAAAFGLTVPPARARVDALRETLLMLPQLWNGERVTFEGEYLHFTDAAVLPVPPAPIPIVVGVGNSRRLIRSAVEYADELNLYGEEDVIRFAREQVDASGRDVALSVYAPWGIEQDKLKESIKLWENLGVERVFVTHWPPFDFSSSLELLS